MKRIATVLKASEVTAVRKAVCVAGASRIVITPISHRECAIDLRDWCCGTPVSERDDHVRLDVTVSNNRSDDVISAILTTAHVGKIERIASPPTYGKPSCITVHQVRGFS